MRPEDLTVEVRDKNLQRQGKVLSRDLDLQAKIRWCGVGEWTLTLPGNHTMVPHLLTPGSGLVVTGPTGTASRGVIFSGPTTLPKRKRDQKNPDGTLTFTGVTDEVHLDDALAFPNPTGSADPAKQTKANDIRTGPTEDLFRQYVAFNVTHDQALPGRVRGFRRFIGLKGTSGSRGLTQTKAPRFQNLLELLQEIAIYDGGYGFRLQQEDDLLLFDTVPVRDLRTTIRLDMNNGTLTSEEIASQGATVTDAIVGGQGEGTERRMVQRQDPTDESTWSRVIERFYDRRDTNDVTILRQKGDEELAAGTGGTSAKMVPADDQTMRYLIDWREGDWITVVVDGQERDSVVTEAILLVNSTACRVGVAIGDVSTFDPRDRETKNQQTIDSRVGYLERNLSVGWLAGDIKETARTTAPDGWLMCDGSVKNRADYPVLFQAIGTTYNTGGETNAQFRLPSRQGRVGVGRDATQTEFDTLGELGGAKTHTLTAAEMPAHTHRLGAYASGVEASGYGLAGGGGFGGRPWVDAPSAPARTSTEGAGGGGAHNNLQPYVVLNYLIKT